MLRPLIQVAFSYIGAMYSSNLALNYMSYPAQSLLKSSKMVPVMLMRIVTVGQRYTLQEYIQVFVITGGICSFMLFEDGAKSGKETSLIGLALCVVSLILDGFTGPTQERINAQHRPSMAQMMFFLNFWAILLVLTLLLLTGQLWTGLRFFANYPEVLPEVAVFSLLSALGQAAILVTVLNFNSLILTTITTSHGKLTYEASWLHPHRTTRRAAVLTAPLASPVCACCAMLSAAQYSQVLHHPVLCVHARPPPECGAVGICAGGVRSPELGGVREVSSAQAQSTQTKARCLNVCHRAASSTHAAIDGNGRGRSWQ